MKIFVAVHKSAKLYGDSSYQFIHVGATMHPDVAIEGALKDNVSDDNISDRNAVYCELTGIYHIWKNIHDVEYVGLCHYRRYLSHKQYIGDVKFTSGSDGVDVMSVGDTLIIPKLKK